MENDEAKGLFYGLVATLLIGYLVMQSKNKKIMSKQELQKQMEKCVEEENYEQAAILRDEIKTMQEKIIF